MLIHQQNSYALRGKRRSVGREAQGRGTGQQSKNLPCIVEVLGLEDFCMK
jgi:hypothetical protein